MPGGLEAKLDPYAVQIARRADGRKLIPGSGYLASPGRIVTALHCVLDIEQVPTVPAEPATCFVRTVADLELRSPTRAWDPNQVAAEIDRLGEAGSIWRAARLVWPPAGASTRRLDVAIVEVAPDDRTVAMRSAPQIAFMAPSGALGCVGFGFPEWRQRKLPGGEILAELHAVKGTLQTGRRLTDTMNNFRVENGSPPAPPANAATSPWGGLSGAVLFDEETGLAAGIVGRWEPAFDLSVLGVTLASSIPDSNEFWAAAGLTRPIRRVADIRRFAIASKTAREFVYLLDRKDQLGEFNRSIGYPEAAPAGDRTWPPIVSVVVSRPRDESTEMIRRFERHLAKIHSKRRFVYMAMPRIPFPKSIDDADRAASTLLGDFADKLSRPDLAARLRSLPQLDMAAIAPEFRGTLQDGVVARAFQIEVPLDGARAVAPEVLARFLAQWASIGTFDTPIALFIRLLTRDRNSDDPVDDRVAPFLTRLEECVRGLDPQPLWIRLSPLGDCCDDHLDDWENDLAEESFAIPFGFLDDLRRHLEGILKRHPDTFALRDFLYALDHLRV